MVSKDNKLFVGATIAKEHLPAVLRVLESRDSAWYSVAADFGMQVTSVVVVFLLKPLMCKSQPWGIIVSVFCLGLRGARYWLVGGLYCHHDCSTHLARSSKP